LKLLTSVKSWRYGYRACAQRDLFGQRDQNPDNEN
jgi:hypothetical protein